MFRLAIVGALAGALLVVPAADAAKVRVKSGIVRVGDSGVAPIKLKNPNRSKAKGKVTLKSGSKSLGSKRFKLRGKRSGKVKVALSASALSALSSGGNMEATAVVSAKGKGRSRKGLVLRFAGSSSGGDQAGGGSTGGGSSQAWADGRWQGTWATNNTDLAFNITGSQLATGPFDGFYLQANCEDGDTDATAFEPVNATIAPDGSFSGSGTYMPAPDHPMPWTLTGHVSGKSLTGTFSASYESYADGHCSGSASFTAAWYGAYTLKIAAR